MQYKVMFRSVDGAGFVKEENRAPDAPEVPRKWDDRVEAQKYVDGINAECKKDGNPFGYRYSVQENRYYR